MNRRWLKRGFVLASSLAKLTASSLMTQRVIGVVLLALSTAAMSSKSLRVMLTYSLIHEETGNGYGDGEYCNDTWDHTISF